MRKCTKRSLINKSTITTNIYKAQAYYSVMCGMFALDLLILCLKVKA